LAHGDGLRAFEFRGVGSAIRGMSGRHRVAAFPRDLAFGAWSHNFAGVGDDGVWRAVDRTIARPLQCRRTRGSRRSTPPQRRIGNDLEARASGEAARSPSRTAARWRAMVEPQGGRLDGGRTRLHVGRAAAGLGGFEGDRLVDPEAASKEPEIGQARRGSRVQKSSRMQLPKKPQSIPAKRSRSSPRTSIALA
jgi:hypothetical protein